jgi:GTP-binding protein
VVKEVNGERHEPYENLVIDIDEQHQGKVIEELGQRRAEMQEMSTDGKGRTRLSFIIPTRGLIGFRTQFMSMTSGTGILTHIFDHFGPVKAGDIGSRINGVMVSMVKGKTLAYALFSLQERGRLFIEPNIEVYEGMIVGLHSRENDLVVNPTKAKQLTNIRAAGSDENIILTPPIRHSLEQAMEFIDSDELVEITPNHIRLRKQLLLESDRKRASRPAKEA